MDNSGSTSQPLPPYYILVSHSSVNNAAPGAQSSNFSHPIIQYQYQDDSALPLLPQHPDEHVLILDYEPLAQKPSVVKSISPDLVVTGLKVDDAPGAAAADEKNAHMFVIETTSDDQAQSSSVTEKLPHATLAQFKQRNAILRRALVFPEDSKTSVDSSERTSDPQSSFVPPSNA
ncbi:hypothetical protein Agabi119p4_632 [Agaricus bisporus var. burnettii]|uniref:Uncharacterized protein n=1 Tax=Agaricus bisporus var. burnettii TaxID=192524 RepID=A0A8H7KL84_AGABI|nr:hypothetical protein Agabi119p4_632 [Agaricus bisporus var. burnettii]